MVSTPGPADLSAIIEAMGRWRVDPDLAALHVGDLGWNQQFGAESLAANLRLWHLGDRLAAVGLLDEPTLLRLVVAPEARHDDTFVQALADDLDRVLPPGEVAVEARFDGPLHGLLLARGWEYADPWTPLVRDLSAPVERHHLRVEEVTPERVEDRIRVHHASFDLSTFTAERWQRMTESPAHAHARSLLGYDEDGNAVAMVTVWAMPDGGAGELEPMGVHRDHRGRGHGRAICLAAAQALQELGASHAFVSTPSSNTGAIRTYASAGYVEKPQVRDLQRSA